MPKEKDGQLHLCQKRSLVVCSYGTIILCYHTYTVTLKQLFIDDVNFFNLYELGTLESDCNENKYPPRMVIEVSSDSSVTVFQSKIKLTFTGARREFPTEISLSSPLSKTPSLCLALLSYYS